MSYCKMMNYGTCDAPIPGQTNVFMYAEEPFSITARQNNLKGFALLFCYTCYIKPTGQNDLITFNHNMVVASHTGTTCDYALEPKGYMRKKGNSIKYNSKGSYHKFGKDFRHFFNHKQRDKCWIRKCYLRKSGSCDEDL